MRKNTMKAYLVCGLAVIGAGAIFTISSCKKDAASVKVGVAEPSSTPIKYGKYTYFSNTNKHVGIMVEDANGNLVTIESIRKAKGNQTLSSCLDNWQEWDLVYRGYTVEDPCFGATGQNNLSHSWDLYLPEDVNIVNNATCVAKVKIGPFGFPAPTGTGYRTTPYQYYYVETVNVAGTMLKKWRIVADGTPITEQDYCGNLTLTPTFKLKTDCDDLATISPASFTDYFDINSLTIPDFILSNGSDGSRKILFVPQLPICGSGCHGYWKWCTKYQVQYKLTTSSSWSGTFDQNSNVVTSFKIPVTSGNGTYQVRYKGLIKDVTSTSTDIVWSEWIQPTTTVVIP